MTAPIPRPLRTAKDFRQQNPELATAPLPEPLAKFLRSPVSCLSHNLYCLIRYMDESSELEWLAVEDMARYKLGDLSSRSMLNNDFCTMAVRASYVSGIKEAMSAAAPADRDQLRISLANHYSDAAYMAVMYPRVSTRMIESESSRAQGMAGF